jgi:hypothetical protein
VIRTAGYWNPSLVEMIRLDTIVQSRVSSVGIGTGYGLDCRGWFPDRGKVILERFFSKASTPALGPTQPPIQWVQGALSPVVKR